jgi:CYTH domain-containing protein
MSTETERKFLLKDPSWRPDSAPVYIEQGFYRLGESSTGRVARGPLGFMFILDENLKVPLLPQHGPHAESEAKANGGTFPAGWKARIRCRNQREYVLDLKGPRVGASRGEFDENPLPADIGKIMLEGCGSTLLRKQRYTVPFAGKNWALDIYAPPYTGLVVAEVELTHPDEVITIPDWAGREITHEKLFGGVWKAPAP